MYSVRLQITGLLLQDSPEALCCVVSHILDPLLSTGSKDRQMSRHDRKIVDWDVKNKHKKNKN